MSNRIVTVGADPEVFLRSKSEGIFVSAVGMFEGTKEDPKPLGNYGFVQVDGHALEFNTIPAATEDEFVTNVNNIFGAVKEYVASVDDDLEIVLDPVAHFDEDYFRSLPEASKVLGCTPDYSSLTGFMLQSPPISHMPIRTSSGHIHVGWTASEDAFEDEIFAQRLKAASIITPHLLTVSKEWETNASFERRNYYGGSGAFRPKSYGVELRALDAQWLASEDRMRRVFRAAIEGFNLFAKETNLAA